MVIEVYILHIILDLLFQLFIKKPIIYEEEVIVIIKHKVIMRVQMEVLNLIAFKFVMFIALESVHFIYLGSFWIHILFTGTCSHSNQYNIIYIIYLVNVFDQSKCPEQFPKSF